MLDPRIKAAVARLGREGLERDLRALAVRRHHRRDPAGLELASTLVKTELTRAGYSVRLQPVLHDGTSVPNVIAERPGTERPGGRAGAERVVVVCAHYDAVEGTVGADDNASAVAGMLAIARAAAQSPTRATLRFIAFAFEEEGLKGSSSYVGALDQRERERIAGVFDLEMIGFTAEAQTLPEGIELFSEESLPSGGDFIAVVGLSEGPEPVDALRDARHYVTPSPACRKSPNNASLLPLLS